jgi:integral membrane protein (TIGR01906 family)
VSGKANPPSEDGRNDVSGRNDQQFSGADADLAKALADHQSGSDEAPAFEWLAAGSAEAGKTPTPPAATQAPATQPAAARPDAARPDGKEPDAGKPEVAAPARPLKVELPAAGGDAEPMRAPSTLPAALKTEVPTETTMLAIRPPEAEIERRNAERAQAADAKPVLPRVWQVLVAVFFPFVLLLLAIRAIATPVFLWVEYYRPGFPADSFGFSSDDRLTYGSYAVDYLNNFTGPRFLGDLVGSNGQPLFQAGEVSHMADVKGVYMMSMLAGLVLLIAMIVGIVYLGRRSVGGIRRALFAGSAATLLIIIGLGVFAVLGWEQFFTGFHQIFFANGTWTFRLSDSLIKLFPEQFWTDAGGTIAVLVLLAAALTFAFSWPTKRRRERSAAAARRPQGRRAAL